MITRWFVVEGLVARPHQTAFENLIDGPFRNFTSFPIRAKNAQAAIHELFAKLTSEFESTERILQNKNDDDWSDEDLQQIWGAKKPIGKDRWRATRISDKEAEQRLERQKRELEAVG